MVFLHVIWHCLNLSSDLAFISYQNVLLISGVLIAGMTASVKMAPSVIRVQGRVPAPLDGRDSSVESHVTRVTMVTNVNNSVLV